MIKEYHMIPGVYSIYSVTFKKLWECKSEKERNRRRNKLIKLENNLYEHLNAE